MLPQTLFLVSWGVFACASPGDSYSTHRRLGSSGATSSGSYPAAPPPTPADQTTTQHCTSYCAAFSVACAGTATAFSSDQACKTACAVFPVAGTPWATTTTGDSVECRRWHLSMVAMKGLVHCEHAAPSGGGKGKCVQATPSSPPPPPSSSSSCLPDDVAGASATSPLPLGQPLQHCAVLFAGELHLSWGVNATHIALLAEMRMGSGGDGLGGKRRWFALSLGGTRGTAMLNRDIIVGVVDSSSGLRATSGAVQVFDMHAPGYGTPKSDHLDPHCKGGAANVALISAASSVAHGGGGWARVAAVRPLRTNDDGGGRCRDYVIVPNATGLPFAAVISDVVAAASVVPPTEKEVLIGGMPPLRNRAYIQISLTSGRAVVTDTGLLQLLRRAHGAALAFVWAALTLVGASIARYGRHRKNWFLHHRLCQTVASCLTVPLSGLAFYARFLGNRPYGNHAHGKLGVCLGVLSFVQGCLGVRFAHELEFLRPYVPCVRLTLEEEELRRAALFGEEPTRAASTGSSVWPTPAGRLAGARSCLGCCRCSLFCGPIPSITESRMRLVHVLNGKLLVVLALWQVGLGIELYGLATDLKHAYKWYCTAAALAIGVLERSLAKRRRLVGGNEGDRMHTLKALRAGGATTASKHIMSSRGGSQHGASRDGEGAPARIERGESAADLTCIAAAMVRGLETADRKFHFKVYKDVFTGPKAVDWLITAGFTQDRPAAVALGEALLKAGYFRHCVNEHGFEDRRLFYLWTERGLATAAKTSSSSSSSSSSDVLQPPPVITTTATTFVTNALVLQEGLERHISAADMPQGRLRTLSTAERPKTTFV